MEQNLPAKGSRYEKSGNIYTVIEIANIETTKPDTYPVTVIYKGDNGKVWATTLENWNKKAKFIPKDP